MSKTALTREKKARQLSHSKEKTVEKQQQYLERVESVRPQPPVLRNVILAFVSGGTVCLLGQGIQNAYVSWFGLSPLESSDPTVATMIFLGSLLTGLGLFDRLARFAGAGLAIPVTGFANSVTSSAMEFKREGYVLGVGSRMFQLAGSVIVFGVVTAFVVGLISSLI